MKRRASLPAAFLATALAGCAPADAGTAGDRQSGRTLTLRLNETGRVGDAGITPLAVVEDSRCPADVQCVHAGTVRVATRVSAGNGKEEPVLAVGQPRRVRGLWVTLLGACPTPRAGVRTGAAEYRLSFAMREDAAAALPPTPPPTPPLCR